METLTEYEIASLVGGSERVALVAFVALAKDGRLKVAYKRQRVKVERNEPTGPIEAAALDLVPESGLSVVDFISRMAASSAVLELDSALRARRIRRSRWLVWPSRIYRDLVKHPGTGPRRVAVLGLPGIEDDRLRDILEHPRPAMPQFDNHKSRTFNQLDGTLDSRHDGLPLYDNDASGGSSQL
jgi:hypothetical protein